MNPHEQILQAQITRLEAENEALRQELDEKVNEYRREMEATLRTWESNAMAQNSYFAAPLFRKAADQLRDLQAKGKPV